jgi:hypothetical protein
MKFTFAPALATTLSLTSLSLAQSATPAPTSPESVPALAPPALPVTGIGSGTYLVEGNQLFLVNGESRVGVNVATPVVTVTLHGDTLYVTHGTTAVSVYSAVDRAAPRLEQTLTTGRGLASGVEIVDESPWVVTVSKQALPLSELSAHTSGFTGAHDKASDGLAVVAELPAAKTAPEYALHVVEPGLVEIAAGSDSQVRIGDRFAIFRQTAVGNPDSAFRGEELVALAEVVAVKKDSALAELSRTAVVNDNDVARAALPEQTESNVYPVHVPHVGEFGGTLRPIVNAGSPLGFGALAEIYGSYWGKGYFVSLMLQPLGLGWTDDGNIVSTSALVEGGYDARAFSVGLGVGVSAINGDTDAMLGNAYFGTSEDASSGGDTPQVTDRQETHSAFTLSQWVRLGARDGVNVTLRNLLLLHKDSETNENGFIYGGTMGKLTIPLDRRNDLFLEGGGGVMGYWLVGAGVGTWLVGNGSPGSWKLSISAGAAGIWGTKEVTTTTSTFTYVGHQDVEVGGPMVAFGITRRFGF